MPPMTNLEMLQAMGIDQGNFNDYLARFNAFFNALNPVQKAFHLKNHGRTLNQIAGSIPANANGDTATPAGVQGLFDGAIQPPAAGPAVPAPNMVAAISCCKG